ncbi:MAG: hypothetical protein VKN17_02830 [Cyanobacteriota bacterium]|jgi:hypothetical protein|nr:hypothetical protein [Cyanobacteriota bacterium]
MLSDQQSQPAEDLSPAEGLSSAEALSSVPPPPPPLPEWGSAAEAVFHWNQRNWRQEQLEQELSAAREELAAVQALLEELPQIFERKFQSRLQPILGEQERLLQENSALRQQLLQLQPQTRAQQPVLPPVPEARGLRSTLRRVLPWSGRGGQAA